MAWCIVGTAVYQVGSTSETCEKKLRAFRGKGGKGIQLTKKKNEQQDVGEPWPSPDGKFVYYSEDVYPGGFFKYNKDPNSQIYAINRYNLQDGKIERVTGGPGGAIRPVISHDGKTLAFVRRVREKSALFSYI